MTDERAAAERLAGMISHLDIALLLDEAGVDVRAFAPHELDELSRLLVRRRPEPPPAKER